MPSDLDMWLLWAFLACGSLLFAFGVAAATRSPK